MFKTRFNYNSSKSKYATKILRVLTKALFYFTPHTKQQCFLNSLCLLKTKVLECAWASPTASIQLESMKTYTEVMRASYRVGQTCLLYQFLNICNSSVVCRFHCLKLDQMHLHFELERFWRSVKHQRSYKLNDSVSLLGIYFYIVLLELYGK
jgi:hypothetical protein